MTLDLPMRKPEERLVAMDYEPHALLVRIPAGQSGGVRLIRVITLPDGEWVAVSRSYWQDGKYMVVVRELTMVEIHAARTEVDRLLT